MVHYEILFVIGLMLIAFFYSSVGHGGASGYLALMALFGFAPESIRYYALILNLVVSAIAFISYYRAGFFRWQGGRGVGLIVLNPLALVRKTLLCVCDTWDEAASDLHLSVERVRSALLSIPTLIRSTGCTTSPSELRRIMEDYNIEKHVYDTELSKYKKAWDEFQKHADIVVMGPTEFKNQQRAISASKPLFPEPWMVGLPDLNSEFISKSDMVKYVKYVKYEAGLSSIDSDYVRSLASPLRLVCLPCVLHLNLCLSCLYRGACLPSLSYSHPAGPALNVYISRANISSPYRNGRAYRNRWRLLSLPVSLSNLSSPS